MPEIVRLAPFIVIQEAHRIHRIEGGCAVDLTNFIGGEPELQCLWHGLHVLHCVDPNDGEDVR